MPLDITDKTPRRARTIAGLLVQVPQPFAAGQPLTDATAAMLNQTLAENFSNNLRDKIKEFIPEGAKEGTKPRPATKEEAQKLVDDYASKYEPGVRSGGGGGRAALSPVEKEMRVIARDNLNSLLSEQKIKRGDLPKEGEGSYNSLVDQIIEANEDALRSQAERIVAARENASKGAGVKLGSLSLPSKGGSAKSEGEKK